MFRCVFQDISSTSLVTSSPSKSLRTSPNKSPNMFAAVSPGGRRRSSKGLQQGFSQHRRVSRSPTRGDPRFASLSPERRSRLYQQLGNLDAETSLGARLALADGGRADQSNDCAMVPFGSDRKKKLKSGTRYEVGDKVWDDGWCIRNPTTRYFSGMLLRDRL